LLALVKTPGEACDALFAQTIRECGMHHSFGLRMATNFIVNVIYYGYEERAGDRGSRRGGDIHVTDFGRFAGWKWLV